MQCFHDMNSSRRQVMNKDLHRNYSALCNNTTVPHTSEYLFGDLSKLTKDISDANKLARKVRPQHVRGPNRNFSMSSQRNQGPQGNRRFQPYQRPRNDFFIQRPSSTIKVQKGGGTEKNLITPTKVCAKQTPVDYNDNSLHALLHNQPNFKAGRIANALSEWGNITSDPTILEFVKGVRIAFTPGFSPEGDNVRSSVFNHVQQAIVAKEIKPFSIKES